MRPVDEQLPHSGDGREQAFEVSRLLVAETGLPALQVQDLMFWSWVHGKVLEESLSFLEEAGGFPRPPGSGPGVPFKEFCAYVRAVVGEEKLPQWTAAPAVLARLSGEPEAQSRVWVPVLSTRGTWSDGIVHRWEDWAELRDVSPLYPREES